MAKTILRVDQISKQFRLGQVGTGTLSHDLNRYWHLMRGKEDPYLEVGSENKRAEHASQGDNYVWALRDISFDVKEGDALGIIGSNGAGKSTLLKVLSRITAPTTGRIGYNGRIASLLEVGTGFHPELTGRENIYLNGTILGMQKREVDAKLEEIVSFAGVARYLDTPVKRYSSGMTVRLGFAVAAHLEPSILIIDEVLAVGDADFQDKCIRKMQSIRQEGRTILFVSHNMSSINRLCNRGLLLSNGKVVFESDQIEEVTSEYLNSFDDAKDLKTFSNREGAGNLKLVDFSVLDSGGEKVSSAMSGDSVAVELTIHNYQRDEVPSEDFEIRVLIRNRDDFVIGLLHSRTSEVRMVMKPGENRINIKIKKWPFLNDVFFFDVAIRQKNVLEDRVQKIYKLHITEGSFFQQLDFTHPKFFRGALLEHAWDQQ